MALTVPNIAAVTYPAQAKLTQTDLDIAFGLDARIAYVLYGCAVTAQVSPDGTVAVAAGHVGTLGSEVAVAAGNVNVLSGAGSTAADALLDRIDIIWADVVSGALGRTTGALGTRGTVNEVGTVVPPALPASKAALGFCYVPATATTIASTAANIVDKRPIDPNASGPGIVYSTSGPPTDGTHPLNQLAWDIGNLCFWVCMVAGTPGTWARTGTSGQELGYAATEALSLSAFTASSTDVPGLTKSVTVGTRPIFIEGFIPISDINLVTLARGQAVLYIFEGATLINAAGSAMVNNPTGSTLNIATGGLRVTARLGDALQPSAGSHTYKIAGAVSGGPTAGRWTSGVGYPAYLRITEE